MPAYTENHQARMAYEVIDRRRGTVVSTHATRRKAWNASNKIERTPSLRRATSHAETAEAREALRVHASAAWRDLGLVVR